MKRVGLLTDAYHADPSYSINIVAEDQLLMLVNSGYKPIAIAEDIFEPARAWKLAEMRSIPSGIPRGNEIHFHEANEIQVRGAPHPHNWSEDVQRIKAALDIALEGVDVVITHDLIYQSAALWLNFAARLYAIEHPDVTWLNWVHSASPSPVWTSKDRRLAPVQRHFPNSKTVYPNEYSRPRVATNFNCEVDDVSICPHPTDICGFLGFDETTTRLVQEKRLLEADAILTYPVRLDRGKQVEFVIRTAAGLKAIGRSARVICVDFHSTGGDKVTYRKWLKNLAVDLGMNEIEVTFTSEFDQAWHVSVPRSVVRSLMLLSHVFVMPSRSETYSLIAQEAALCGALLVLNSDFPAFRDIFTNKAAFYQFSSNIDVMTGLDGSTETKYGDVDDYFRCIALRVAYELDNNVVLAQQKRIRQTRNPDYIFKHYIEPLLHWRDGG